MNKNNPYYDPSQDDDIFKDDTVESNTNTTATSSGGGLGAFGSEIIVASSIAFRGPSYFKMLASLESFMASSMSALALHEATITKRHPALCYDLVKIKNSLTSSHLFMRIFEDEANELLLQADDDLNAEVHKDNEERRQLISSSIESYKRYNAFLKAYLEARINGLTHTYEVFCEMNGFETDYHLIKTGIPGMGEPDDIRFWKQNYGFWFSEIYPALSRNLQT